MTNGRGMPDPGVPIEHTEGDGTSRSGDSITTINVDAYGQDFQKYNMTPKAATYEGAPEDPVPGQQDSSELEKVEPGY